MIGEHTATEKPVRAVVFDMDGLLLDSERLAVESLALSGGELGYELSEQFCHSLIGMPADTCRELAVAAFGPDFPLDEFFRRHETVIARLVDDGRLTTKPGVTDLLDELDRRAVPARSPPPPAATAPATTCVPSVSPAASEPSSPATTSSAANHTPSPT